MIFAFLNCWNAVSAQTVQDTLMRKTIEAKAAAADVLKTSTIAADSLKKIQLDSTKRWKYNGIIGFNTSATFLTNWAAGGNNAATMVLFGNIRIIYQKNKFVWETFFDTDFGYSYMDIKYNQWRKSNDKINFSTKAGYKIKKTLYATALGSFRSQYSNGFEYFDDNDSTHLISKWLSPSYTDISLGLDWKPTSYFSLYYSSAAMRITTVLDENLRKKYYGGIYYALHKNSPFKFEGGMTAKAAVNWQYKTLKIVSALTLFTPYNKGFMTKIDMDWDLAVTYQFLKVLNMSLGTTLKYYDSILIPDKEGNSPKQRIQFKNVVGIGVGYTF
ncbi:MAG: DUF3078 domain-containing protein [Prevotellaceae bacterium]|nr:DUF3078 domain-containing protein [Prevotellaceae bacterium]